MTLPIQLVVGANILLNPPLLGTDPFGRGLIIGSSLNSRLALFGIYRSPEAVAEDYGVEVPEYRIALRYFAQIPRPKSLMIATVDIMIATVDIESVALEALQTVWNETQSFYGVCFGDEISVANMQNVTDWCQSHYRLPFFVVSCTENAITSATNLGELNYYTHVTTYHQSHDEVGAIMGMALDQKFDQPNGIKTLKFKTLVGTEPTVIGETLAGQLDAAGVNYYTDYGNPNSPVLMYSQGFAGAGKYADFVMGLHWLRNDAQVEVFNTFRINPKVSQTEGGMSVLKAAVARSCMRGVDNGLIAGGQWNGQPLGTINTGDFLPTGYYIYADKIRNQTQQVRETRQAQPISVLVKGAGALHGADISFIGEQ